MENTLENSSPVSWDDLPENVKQIKREAAVNGRAVELPEDAPFELRQAPNLVK